VDALASAWGSLLAARKELGGVATYRHDLVNVGREALSNHAANLYDKVTAAYEAKDADAYRRASRQFLELLQDMDELLATSDQFLLGQWLEDAKRWGDTRVEREQMEWNARRVLTLWGKGDKLRDYAWKEWSGMINGFYAKRWELFFQQQQAALEKAKPFDAEACRVEVFKFEDEWAKRTDRYRAKAKGDSVAVAQRLFDKYTGQLR
jgi:alpha-N-acetylglucosaminidase